MEQHVNTLLSVYGEDLNRLRNRVGKDRSEHTFRDNFEKQLQDLSSLFLANIAICYVTFSKMLHFLKCLFHLAKRVC